MRLASSRVAIKANANKHIHSSPPAAVHTLFGCNETTLLAAYMSVLEMWKRLGREHGKIEYNPEIGGEQPTRRINFLVFDARIILSVPCAVLCG